VLEDVGAALATYVRTIVAGDSPYDRYLAGDRSALSASARRGFDLFFGRAGCAACHTGPTFTDEQFHNTGVAWTGEDFSDLGRGAVTGLPRDRGAFKTPTLREVSRTAPYMHDGSFATLESVVDFYVGGGRSNPYLDPRLSPLNLTSDQQADLAAFLRSLSGRVDEG
jgi:cytochrome c peroxidase